MPNHALPENKPAVVAHARLVVIGGDHQRLHEEIITAGGVLYPRFNRLNVGEVERAFSEQTDKPVIPGCETEPDCSSTTSSTSMHHLTARAGSPCQRLQQSAEAAVGRARQQRTARYRIDIESNSSASDRNAELDEPDVRGSLICRALAKKTDPFTRTRYLPVCRKFPEEIEREKDAIRKRFDNPQSRLFPVAITFLVPERLNR